MLNILQHQVADPIGVKLRFVGVDDATLPSQVAAAQQSGRATDIVQWTAQGASTLLAAGVPLHPLDSYMNGVDRSNFYPQDLQAGTVNGKLYALGFNCNTRAIAYRTDFARKAGAPPSSWTVDAIRSMDSATQRPWPLCLRLGSQKWRWSGLVELPATVVVDRRRFGRPARREVADGFEHDQLQKCCSITTTSSIPGRRPRRM